MLLFNLELLASEPLSFLKLIGVLAFSILVAITFHEFSHALIAHRLGDQTAERGGRVSLNPLAHLDPFGTLMLFLVGFGWGKPVPVNPYCLRHGPRSGMALVSLAGPASNLVVAVLFALPINLGLLPWHSPRFLPLAQMNITWVLADIIGFVIFYNILLAVFNLIPIAPLDGFKVALGVLPRELSLSLARLESYGPAIQN